MNSLLAFGIVALIGVAPAAAQFGARSGALGGSFASRGISRPLGGIPGPTFPALSPNRNFSGRGTNRGKARPARVGYPFAYSIWVPDSFDYQSDQNPYGAAYNDQGYGPPPAAPAYDQPPAEPVSQQPVIINQYFNTPPPQQTPAPLASDSSTDTPGAGDLLATPPNFYLIAYKNHEVYPALAYWVEDKTLHYVTMQNTHNQASLDLIDVARSKSLNKDRDVPFTIATP
jgi:hypothetical protein